MVVPLAERTDSTVSRSILRRLAIMVIDPSMHEGQVQAEMAALDGTATGSYTRTMIDDFLFCDWDDAPAAMDFELMYDDAIARCAVIVASLAGAAGNGDRGGQGLWSQALELYVMAPAIVNVALNYSVCMQFGLPLHPTEYFEVDRSATGTDVYGAALEDAAFAMLEAAIDLARSAYRLDPSFVAKSAAFTAKLPTGLSRFVYTSKKDKYTWRAAEPSKIRALAATVLEAGAPSLIVGAAHGSIMAGLFLAELLGSDLWFLRFSMFKRHDEAPVVSPRDEAKIRSYGDGSAVLVFDEDTASGTTLSVLSERVRMMAPKARTGAVIRHQSSSFRPDHVGRTWWD